MGIFIVAVLSLIILAFLSMLCIQVLKMEQVILNLSHFVEQKITRLLS